VKEHNCEGKIELILLLSRVNSRRFDSKLKELGINPRMELFERVRLCRDVNSPKFDGRDAPIWLSFRFNKTNLVRDDSELIEPLKAFWCKSRQVRRESLPKTGRGPLSWFELRFRLLNIGDAASTTGTLGMIPESVLSLRSSSVRLYKLNIWPGMEEWRLFRAILRSRRYDKDWICSGSVPERELSWRDSDVREVNTLRLTDMDPVKELLCMWRWHSRVRRKMDDGMLPVRLFLLTSTTTRFVKLPTEIGMDPPNEFEPISKTERRVIEPTIRGSEPRKLFFEILIDCNFAREYIDDGKVPPKALYERSKVTRFVNDATFDGIVPFIELEFRVKTDSLVSRSRCEGTVPENELLVKLRNDNKLQLPIEGTMIPLNRLLAALRKLSLVMPVR
jgi:hypothetical protein